MGSSRIPHIAVDAHGGDLGPSAVVPGAIDAQRQLQAAVRIQLVGDEAIVRAELKRAGASAADFEIIHAPEHIGMSESPAAAIRRKPNSTIVVACERVKAGQSDAFVSAGSTGAVAAAGLLIVGRLPGVRRPAIASVYPTRKGLGLLLDVGANSDCKPHHLLQFATMGRIYAERVLGIRPARVALMNIGEEDSKGSELALEAHRLLRAHEPSFVGNVEGRDLFDAKADVIVTDGFTGNVVLKVLEAVPGFLSGTFRESIGTQLRARLGAWMLLPSLRQIGRRFHYAEYGGAPLLGLNGLLIICHGGSSSEAIANAIKVAERGVRDRVTDRIREDIAREEREMEDRPTPPEAGPQAESVQP